MNAKISRALLVLSALVVTACHHRAPEEGGASKATLKAMPKWFAKPPKDEKYLYAPATATSKDLQIARNKAEAEGRLQLGQQLEVKYSALTRRFAEETGEGAGAQLLQQYEQTYKAVVSQVLVGTKPKSSEFQVEDGVYRAWVLMELPVGAASERLLKQIQAQEQMYARFRASQAFKELNAEVEKYEQWKSGQKP
ncbi:MAG: LPP20 family lipoprotein [Gemmatimonadota bacterium]|nr:LPP20 family lipoprotein [Gemmatimonadota bacterium]